MYIGVNVCELLRQWVLAPTVMLDVIYLKYIQFNETEDGSKDIKVFQNYRKIDREEVELYLHEYILRAFKINVSDMGMVYIVDDMCSFLQFNARYQIMAEHDLSPTRGLVLMLDKDLNFGTNYVSTSAYLAKKDSPMELCLTQVIRRCLIRYGYMK